LFIPSAASKTLAILDYVIDCMRDDTKGYIEARDDAKEIWKGEKWKRWSDIKTNFGRSTDSAGTNYLIPLQLGFEDWGFLWG
jgi:hypothetical protein